MEIDFNHRKLSIQSFCNILRPILGTELMVVDRYLSAIAGTGPYEKNVGSQRPRDSYVDLTLKSGEGFQIAAPGETEQCMRCEMRSLCKYTCVISCPLRHHDRTVGLFGFLGYDRTQKMMMQKKGSFLTGFAEKISEYLVKNFYSHKFLFKDFVSSSPLEHIVNAIDDGVIITDCENNILHVNQFAEKELMFRQNEWIGKKIEMLGDVLETVSTDSKASKDGSTNRSGFFVKKSPIYHGRKPLGHVHHFRNGKKRKTATRTYSFGSTLGKPKIIGASQVMRKLKNLISKVSVNNSRILITGETGTGKELIAQLTHHKSPRAHGPFVAVNCGAIPDTLIESELFGYAEGTFTGARKNGKRGKLELAHGGTIFLDEIGNLSLNGQAKILRFLDNEILDRIGGETPKKLDIRVISATNKNLPEMVEKGLFLEDLYYRLNVVQLEAPPLRERKTDIPLLLRFYIKKNNRRFGGDLQGFSPEAMAYLLNFRWPGNLRELKNVAEYACNVRTSGFADLEDLPPYMSPVADRPGNSAPVAVNTKKMLIEEAIRQFGKSTEGKRKAARHLGISMSTLYRHLSAPASSGSAPENGTRPADQLLRVL